MSYILTASGKQFDYINTDPNSIDINDIALALSHEPRFSGHTRQFYSVAEHCYRVSYVVPSAFAFEALLHDASEAYCRDLPRPLKALLPDYRAIEERVDCVVRARFGLPGRMSPEVHHADMVMLATERRDLMPNDNGDAWECLIGTEARDKRIMPWTSEIARQIFMLRFDTLCPAAFYDH